MKKQCEFSIVVERENGWQRRQCTRCKYTTVSIPDLEQPIYRNCDRQGGLGDLAGWLLSLVGITQARMEAVFGECDCPERQAALNQVGWQVSDRVKWLALQILSVVPRWIQSAPSTPQADPL
jgi:hypothetical protein